MVVLVWIKLVVLLVKKGYNLWFAVKIQTKLKKKT